MLLTKSFFDNDAKVVAKSLLGKVIRHNYLGQWISINIVETEAYYAHDLASHASLGLSFSRRALWAPAGTIYMYYARGGDSLNFSCRGDGNAVLIKAAIPYFDKISPKEICIPIMNKLNPLPKKSRSINRLCSGQTLLCRCLNLKVDEWNNRYPYTSKLRIEDVGITVKHIIRCKRLGIPNDRDEHLILRFINAAYTSSATQNPLTKTSYKKDKDYFVCRN